MGNVNLNPDQSNTKRGGIDAIAAADLTGKRSRLGVLNDNAGAVEVQEVAAVTDLALYLIDDEGVAGAVIPLSPITSEENIRIVAKGVGNAGDILTLADPGTAADKGKVRKVPATAGRHFSPGIAEEDFVDGQLVKIRPFPRLVNVGSADTLTGAADLAALKAALVPILQAHGIVA